MQITNIGLGPEYWGPALGILGAIIAWFVADTKFKVRIETLEERVNVARGLAESLQSSAQDKFDTILLQNATSAADRADIHRQIDKLDSTKASKEVVDSFKQEITVLRLEMDKRFDRLDRLLEYKLHNPKPEDTD